MIHKLSEKSIDNCIFRCEIYNDGRQVASVCKDGFSINYGKSVDKYLCERCCARITYKKRSIYNEQVIDSINRHKMLEKN